MHYLKYHKKSYLHSRCDYSCEAWFLDIQERHPSAQHPTKGPFTTTKNSLYLCPKCHTVLMLQNFQWVFRLRFWYWPCNKSVKQPFHPVSAVSKKSQHCLLSLKVGDWRCSPYWQKNTEYVLVTCDVWRTVIQMNLVDLTGLLQTLTLDLTAWCNFK